MGADLADAAVGAVATMGAFTGAVAISSGAAPTEPRSWTCAKAEMLMQSHGHGERRLGWTLG